MDQRRESWNNSNTIIVFTDIVQKKKKKRENPDVLDSYKIQKFYKSSKDRIYFPQNSKDNRGVIKCIEMSENNKRTWK